MATIPTVLPFHTIVDVAGIVDEDFNVTFNLNANVAASGSVENAQGSEGSAVTLDTSANYTVKLGAAQDRILGLLLTTEARSTGKVGTVAMQGVMKFPLDTGVTVVVGDTLVCSGSATGKVCARLVSSSDTPDLDNNIVIGVFAANTSTAYPYGYAVAYFR